MSNRIHDAFDELISSLEAEAGNEYVVHDVKILKKVYVEETNNDSV